MQLASSYLDSVSTMKHSISDLRLQNKEELNHAQSYFEKRLTDLSSMIPKNIPEKQQQN